MNNKFSFSHSCMVIVVASVVSKCWLAFCTTGFGIRFACGEGH